MEAADREAEGTKQIARLRAHSIFAALCSLLLSPFSSLSSVLCSLLSALFVSRSVLRDSQPRRHAAAALSSGENSARLRCFPASHPFDRAARVDLATYRRRPRGGGGGERDERGGGRRALIGGRLRGGAEVVLAPGDALLVPPYFWHEVESLDEETVSVSLFFEGAHSHTSCSVIRRVTSVTVSVSLFFEGAHSVGGGCAMAGRTTTALLTARLAQRLKG